MFSISIRKKLTDTFRAPVRTRQLSKVAETVIKETRYTLLPDFCRALLAEDIIQEYTLKSRNGKIISLYSSRSLNDITPYELAVGICPDGYFCNLTSIYHHALTDQIPNVVYICNETMAPRISNTRDALTNTQIRNAFIKPHRYTNNIVEYRGHGVIVVDRVKRTDHGVMAVSSTDACCPHGSRVTCLERALIDAVVAPQYNGGVASLCAYFQAARKKMSISKLLDIYGKLKFVFPYAQSIGFILDAVGMHKEAIEVRNVFPPRKPFYIDHDAKSSWIYDERWMLYFPKGLVDEG